jgi:EAL domain-containing protein (putative c-di-GMP-specific phosphodiesterase class I)
MSPRGSLPIARLANDIQDALQQTGVDPSRLQLEMTEKIASADPKLTVTVLSHLKHFGIGTVLDDFGTGSTSLVGLKQFPVDALKIDRSLIREMQTDRSASDIVELIILLAHKMNLKVIAEASKRCGKWSDFSNWDASTDKDISSRSRWKPRRH